MSEERFVVGSNEIGEIIVTDVETDRVYRYGDISKFFGLIRLLNEQQATITAQKKGLDEYMDNIIALSKENEQLRQVVEEYRKTNKHLCELCADASKNGYLPPLEDLQ